MMADIQVNGKCYTKSRQWTQNELTLFVQVLVDDKEKYCHILEELALKKKTNTELFQRIRKTFDAARREASFHRQNLTDNFSGWVKYTELDTKVVKLRRKYSNLKQKWKMTADRIKHGSSLAPKKDPGWYNKLNEVLSEWHHRQSKRENGHQDCTGLSSGCGGFKNNHDILNAQSKMVKNESSAINTAQDNFSIVGIEAESIDSVDDENNTCLDKTMILQNDKDRESDSFNIISGVNESFKVDYLMDEHLNLEVDSEGSTTSDYDTTEEHLYPNSVSHPNWTEVPSPLHRRKRRFSNDEEDRIAESIYKLMETQEKRWKEYVAEERRRDQLFLNYKREEAENERQHQIKLAEIFASMHTTPGNSLSPSFPTLLLRTSKGQVDRKRSLDTHMYDSCGPKSPEF